MAAVLGDVAQPLRARMDPRRADGLPFIGLEHVEPNTMRLLGTKAASEMRSSGFRFEPDDVLYGRLRPYLNKVYRPDFPGLASAEFIVLTATDRIAPQYLQYVLGSTDFVQYASSLNTGDRPRVDFEQMARYRVLVPPIDEQHRIATLLERLLSDLDDCSAQLAATRRRHHAFQRSLLQATKAGAAGWRAATIPEVTVNRDGRRIPLKRTDRARRHGVYPYYGASGVIDWIDDYLFDGEFLLVAEDGANLLSRSTPIAFRAAGRFWVNNHAHVLEPGPDIDVRFLEFALNAIDLRLHVTGTAQPKLTQGALNRIELRLPSLDEQRAIVARIDQGLSVAENARSLLSSAFTRLEAMRFALIRSGLSGTLAMNKAH